MSYFVLCVKAVIKNVGKNLHGVVVEMIEILHSENDDKMYNRYFSVVTIILKVNPRQHQSSVGNIQFQSYFYWQH